MDQPGPEPVPTWDVGIKGCSLISVVPQYNIPQRGSKLNPWKRPPADLWSSPLLQFLLLRISVLRTLASDSELHILSTTVCTEPRSSPTKTGAILGPVLYFSILHGTQSFTLFAYIVLKALLCTFHFEGVWLRQEHKSICCYFILAWRFSVFTSMCNKTQITVIII